MNQADLQEVLRLMREIKAEIREFREYLARERLHAQWREDNEEVRVIDAQIPLH